MSDLDSPVFTSVAHIRHRIAELFGSLRVSTHFHQIFLPSVDRISDSSSRTSLARPCRTSSESELFTCSRVVSLNGFPSRWDPRSPQPQLIPALRPASGFRWCTFQLSQNATHPHVGPRVATTSIPSITYKPPIVISSLLDEAGVERTTVPEPSAVGTIIGGDAGLAFTTGLPEISLVGVSLGRAPLRSLRSCGARSESFVLASARQDRMMKTLAPAVPPVLILGTRWQAQ